MSRTKARAGTRVLVASVLAVIAAIHLFSLLRYPPPFVDEAWAACRSWAFLTTGIPFGGLDAGVFEHFPAYRTYFPFIPTAIQAVPLWIVGEPALGPMRLLSLIFGFALCVACYYIGRSFGGRQTGLVAFALTGLSAPFFYTAHLARWDIIVAALGYAALALYQYSSPERLWLDFLSGLLAGLAFEVHPHAAMFSLTLLALQVLKHRRSTLASRPFWACVGGLVIGGSVYLIIHVVPYPVAFLALTKLAHGPTHTPPLATLQISIIWQGVVDAARVVTLANPFWAASFAIAAVWIAFAGARYRVALIFAALIFLSFALLVRNKLGYYVIFVTPAFDLLLATFAVSLFEKQRSVVPAPLVGAIVGVAIVLGLSINLMVIRHDGSRDFRDTLSQLLRIVQPGDRLLGAQTYWFGLPQHKYFSWEQLIFYKRYRPQSDLAEAFHEFKPDLFILDGHLARFVHDPTDASGAYSGHLNISRRELMRFLQTRASVVADFDGKSYGHVTVYRIDWSRP